MSFAEKEVGPDTGEPVNLYLFRYGPGDSDIVGYCDGEQDIEFDGSTYTAIPIDRGEITSSGTLENSTLTITAPNDNYLADLFRLYPPSHTVTLIIRQGHLEDPDAQFLVAWSGRVIGFGVEGTEANYTCEPLGVSLKRNGLRRHYQYGCPHPLYGEKCLADKTAATNSAVVLGVSGATVSVASDWETEERKPKYANGIAEWILPDGRTERRTILRSELDGTIILGGYAYGLDPGETISLILGCNHRAGVAAQPDGDCQPLHDNIRNFGGQMWIPTKNPVGLRNNFY